MIYPDWLMQDYTLQEVEKINVQIKEELFTFSFDDEVLDIVITDEERNIQIKPESLSFIVED